MRKLSYHCDFCGQELLEHEMFKITLRQEDWLDCLVEASEIHLHTNYCFNMFHKIEEKTKREAKKVFEVLLHKAKFRKV